MNRTILFFALLALMFASCDFDCLEGRGALKTETRQVGSFSKLLVAVNARVVISKGSEQSVRVEAQPNILQVLHTEINGKWLNIDTEGCITDHKPITIYVTTPNIEALQIDGNGFIEGKSTFATDRIGLTINGSGNITLDLNAKEVKSEIKGSGNITVSGSARESSIDIAGSGDYNAPTLAADNCKVDVRGSGNCRVFAITKLAVDIAGSGNVYYKGTPDISSNINGSGKLEKSL